MKDRASRHQKQSSAGRGSLTGLTRVFVAYGFRAAPFWMTAALVLSVGTALASVFYPVGIKVMVDAFLSHDRGGVVLGAGLVAGLYALQWILSNNGATAGTTLADHVNLYLSARIAALVNQVAGINHLEHPEYLTELDLLDENRPLLAQGPRQMIMVLSVVIRIVGVVVLLGIIWWPLALLPVVTVLPIASERLSVMIRQRSDEKVAEERRLANELFDIAAAAAPAKELRVFGLAPELARRHHEAGRRVVFATTRASLIGGAVGATGWLLFAAGFGLAVVAVAVRAAHGESSPVKSCWPSPWCNGPNSRSPRPRTRWASCSRWPAPRHACSGSRTTPPVRSRTTRACRCPTALKRGSVSSTSVSVSREPPVRS